MVKAEKDGTVIAGADSPASDGSAEGVLDLRPDPASLRDMATRLRDDAELTPDNVAKAPLIASAVDAETMAEKIEAAALWTSPARK